MWTELKRWLLFGYFGLLRWCTKRLNINLVVIITKSYWNLKIYSLAIQVTTILEQKGGSMVQGQVFLKLVSAIFIKFLFFDQMITLQKLWKMLFISSKKLFSFLRFLQIFVFLPFPLFLPVGHCFRGWSKINLKVHDVINCLNKNSVTHFVWYLEKEKRYHIETLSIEGVSDKEHFYRKTIQKICSKS